MSPTRSIEESPPRERAPHEPPFTPMRLIIAEIAWNIFDTLVLFRLGTIYLHRFEEFANCDHKDHDAEDDEEVKLWRTTQQAEWVMLSTSVRAAFGG